MSQDNRNSIERRLDEYNSTLVRLTVTVEEHVRRTNVLEEKIVPIEDHVKFVNTLVKMVVGAGGFLVALRALHLF